MSGLEMLESLARDLMSGYDGLIADGFLGALRDSGAAPKITELHRAIPVPKSVPQPIGLWPLNHGKLSEVAIVTQGGTTPAENAR